MEASRRVLICCVLASSCVRTERVARAFNPHASVFAQAPMRIRRRTRGCDR